MKNDNNTKKSNGKIILIILGIAVGVFLLIYGSYAEKKNETEKTSLSESSAEMDADAYAREAESRIAKLCQSVRGVSNVHVSVTLAGGYSAVYAQNSQSGSSGYKNEFVLTGNGSSEKALLIGYSVPQISGVGIVCTGGGDADTRREIIALVGAAFGVSSNKIYVTEAQN